MSISLCMIAKNEENFLENCLNNIKDFVDEIIIADTGSKDKTKEIAGKFTNKIYDFKWQNDFSKARNFSLQKASKDWILVLDADEKISGKDLNKIKKLAESNEFTACSFIQRTYSDVLEKQSFSGRRKSKAFSSEVKKLKWNCMENDSYEESRQFIGWTYRRITRLFKNNKGIKFAYPIHETVIESIKKLNGKILSANIPIHHFEILKGKNFINKKSDYYAKLLKNKIKSYPKAKFYFELALQLENLGRRNEAKSYFNRAIELNSDYKRLINSP